MKEKKNKAKKKKKPLMQRNFKCGDELYNKFGDKTNSSERGSRNNSEIIRKLLHLYCDYIDSGKTVDDFLNSKLKIK